MIAKHLLSIPLFALLATASIPENYTCPEHLYKIHIFSNDPLVIYIPEFITEFEAQHLQDITHGKFESSRVADGKGQEHLATIRTSQSTSILSDPVVQCIEARALSFQSPSLLRTHLEPLQLVRYSTGENYRPHTDWFTAPSQTTAEFGGNRDSSFFVYVAGAESILGGGTQFPLLDAAAGEAWCAFVNCDASWEEGVTFRPVVRNAVFWKNMKSGEGDHRTLHAGLPVQRGWKLGMNIWTRERPLHEKYRGVIVE